MDLDLEPPLDDAHDETPDRKGVVELLLDVVRRPAGAMRHLAAHPGRRWILPLVVLAVLGVLTAVVAVKASQDEISEAMVENIRQMQEDNPANYEQAFGDKTPEEAATQTQSFMAVGLAFGVVAALVAAFAGPLIGAAVLHFLGTIFGGQQSYTQMLSTTAWARLPLIFRGLLQLTYGLTGGGAPGSGGLAGLIGPDAEGATRFLAPVLAQVEVWNIWALALMAVAVYVVARVSRAKAIGIVLIYVLLQVLVGEIGVIVGGFFAGLAS